MRKTAHACEVANQYGVRNPILTALGCSGCFFDKKYGNDFSQWTKKNKVGIPCMSKPLSFVNLFCSLQVCKHGCRCFPDLSLELLLYFVEIRRDSRTRCNRTL